MCLLISSVCLESLEDNDIGISGRFCSRCFIVSKIQEILSTVFQNIQGCNLVCECPAILATSTANHFTWRAGWKPKNTLGSSGIAGPTRIEETHGFPVLKGTWPLLSVLKCVSSAPWLCLYLGPKYLPDLMDHEDLDLIGKCPVILATSTTTHCTSRT